MPRAAATTAPNDIFRPAQRAGAGAGVVPGLYGLGIGYPDYFQLPEAPGERSGIGFGGEPDSGHGYGNFDIVSSRALPNSTPPCMRRVACSTYSPCLSDADRCLRSDVTPNPRRQVSWRELRRV